MKALLCGLVAGTVGVVLFTWIHGWTGSPLAALLIAVPVAAAVLADTTRWWANPPKGG